LLEHLQASSLQYPAYPENRLKRRLIGFAIGLCLLRKQFDFVTESECFPLHPTMQRLELLEPLDTSTVGYLIMK